MSRPPFFSRYVERNGDGWERATLPVIQAAGHTGNAKVAKAYATAFLLGSPSGEAGEIARKIIGGG
ncbi:MAG: hypothetical protein M5R36_03885 [Deltaproteobacteria bacterium]|nr:hypothetical protein [Deltaproteobacteria bacterium]